MTRRQMTSAALRRHSPPQVKRGKPIPPAKGIRMMMNGDMSGYLKQARRRVHILKPLPPPSYAPLKPRG